MGQKHSEASNSYTYPEEPRRARRWSIGQHSTGSDAGGGKGRTRTGSIVSASSAAAGGSNVPPTLASRLRFASTGGAQQSNAKSKQTPRQPPRPLTERKAVLFDFHADSRYPEQVSVRQDEVVIFHEDCGDGWARISAYSNVLRRGVVPSSYLGPIIDRSKGNVMKQKIDQRVYVIKSMAQAKANDVMSRIGDMFSYGAKSVVFDGIVPFARRVIAVVSNRESMSNIISQIGRNVNFFIVTSLLSAVTEEELGLLKNQIDEDIAVMESEKQRRRSSI